MPEVARAEYLEELANLEASALGGLDLVDTALTRTLEAVEHQDVELAQIALAPVRRNEAENRDADEEENEDKGCSGVHHRAPP